jgi:putative Holliday junction resolvase
MQRGRRIAFDYGDVRIGVSLSDPDSILASPLTTLSSTDPKLFSKIKELFDEHEPVGIYIGNPLNLSGQTSSSAEKSAAFADRLRAEYALPIMMVDERLSTVSATKSLQESGVNARAAKSIIDMAAAVAILEQGLAIEKAQNVQ